MRSLVAKSRGPYFAIRLAARRPRDVAAIVSYYGHFRNPNAPEPQQIFSVAPEVAKIDAPVLMLMGDADFEIRRFVNGRAFYALWERGVPVELQMYPMARRAFDFRPDQNPEEKVAARHAAQREREWLRRHMRLDASGRCRQPARTSGRISAAQRRRCRRPRADRSPSRSGTTAPAAPNCRG